MKKKSILIFTIMSIASASFAENKDLKEQSANPLLQPWTGPYNGVPAFDKVKEEYFIPAFEAAFAEKKAEIQKIASNKEAPDFKNTIEAMEKAGATLNRVRAIYDIWSSNLNTPTMTAIQEKIEPQIAAFNDEIVQNKPLFLRIEKVCNDTVGKKYSVEQHQLLKRYYNDFVLAGAKLNDADKAKVAVINSRLATLFTQFSKNQLADENEKFIEIKNESELAGLPDDLKSAYAKNAKERGKSTWTIANTRSAVEPFLTFANNRGLRKQVWTMFINRGDNGDANDNNKIIPEILKLRYERAKLMGFETFAHQKLSDKMAKTPEATMKLMESVWPAAIARVKEEVADMQKIADKENAGIKIEPWDYRYYAEKVRKEKYDLDQNEVKQYLQLEKLREGMFFVAGELFNLSFTQVHDVPVFHPDVTVYKVEDKTTHKLKGIWYFDPYARTGKRSGAWMTAYREQEKLSGNVTTIVSNNCNYIKGSGNDPVLISWDDATTLFHEFGHALHGLCSDVTYPTISGTNVARDYVEFPSQVLERWLPTATVLQKYAMHYKTGHPLPQSLLEKLNNASKFNQGFETTEYLSSALVDMKIHLAGDNVTDPDQFEKETLAALNMPSEIVMRHRLPQFGHIFSSDGYAAGYYSYLWSDVISADATEAFTEAGGLYDKNIANKLYRNVFSVGASIDESTGYRNFRGHDPDVKALMRSRGFPDK